MNFQRLANAHRLKEPLREAVRLVLVDGLSNGESSRQTGVSKSQLGKRLTTIRASHRHGYLICPCCGGKI